MNKSYFISGTGTDVGKTFVSNVIIHYLDHYFSREKTILKGKYCKIIQTGQKKYDENTIKSSYYKNWSFKTLFHFSLPASPHLSMVIEKKKISFHQYIDSILEYHHKNPTEYSIFEGSGGLLVPLCKKIDNYLHHSSEEILNFHSYSYFMMIDIVKALNFPLILVGESTLGSINHTLLSVEYLMSKNIKPLMIVLTTPQSENSQNEKIIINDNIDIIQKLTNQSVIFLPHAPNIEKLKSIWKTNMQIYFE